MQRHIRVLLADDRPHTREGLRALLATVRLSAHGDVRSEVEVVGEAADGQEAVRLVEECHPDVVLMDARMPVMDGLEATRRIKDNWPAVKVIMLTMYGSYRSDALAAGADAFVNKADPPEQLLETILTINRTAA
jgi:DNA-binding NarL/FixJ family response regulator